MIEANYKSDGVITLVIDGFKQGGGQEVYKLILPLLAASFATVNLIILEKTPFDIEISKIENLHIHYLKKSWLDVS